MQHPPFTIDHAVNLYFADLPLFLKTKQDRKKKVLNQDYLSNHN